MNPCKRFRELHESGFIIPNPWDVGSARLLASLGFDALATTSSGHAATLGRLDGRVTRDEAIEHARTLAGATTLPLSADLEQGFGDAPEFVAETIRMARAAGLAGCSIEDYGGEANPKLYDIGHATERIAAAVAAAGDGDDALVLTARAENHIRGNPDLKDTIARLQAFQQAGAPVLYAPGLTDLDDVRSVVGSIDRPLNALIMPGALKI